MNLTGQKFGEWIVLPEKRKKKNSDGFEYAWACKCSCGTTRYVLQRSLLSGTSRSCGCMKNKDMIGKKSGHLVIIEHIKKERYNYWLCLCDCGGKRIVTTSDFYLYKSCGKCLIRGSSGKLRNILNGSIENILESYIKKKYSVYKKNCRRNGAHREFNLSFDMFSKFVTDNCFYCGDLPEYKTLSIEELKTHYASHIKTKSGLLNGIDRIDSSMGYVENNCVPCCERCNRMKLNLSVEDFYEHITKIKRLCDTRGTFARWDERTLKK